MNFTLTYFFSFDPNEKNEFYGLWQQQKQLKTMEMNEAWSDIYNEERYRHIFQPAPTQNISKTIPISTRIIKSCQMNRNILFWVWRKVSGNWDNNMIRISKRSKSHYKTNTRIRGKNKPKRGGLQQSHSSRIKES